MYKFKNSMLADKCFNHPSVKVNHEFQRLEFLGDKILSFFLSKIIYSKFPELKEGTLTITLANMVNQRKLYEKGKFLIPCIKINCPINYSSLSDCFEAWIGAVYLDGCDMEQLLLKIFHRELSLNIPVKQSDKNILQEITQKHQIHPNYTYTIDEDKRFICEVNINGYIDYGVGMSKKQASQQSAKNWIKKYSKIAFYDHENK